MNVTIERVVGSKNNLHHIYVDGRPISHCVRQLPANEGRWTVGQDNDGSLFGFHATAQAAVEHAVATAAADQAADEAEAAERSAEFVRRGWAD